MNDKPIWTPDPIRVNNSNMNKFIEFVNNRIGSSFKSYNELYDWSIEQISEFWETIWEYNDIIHSQKPDYILKGSNIISAKWFSSAKLNFAENLLRYRDDRVAIIAQSENRYVVRLTYKELYLKVARCAEGLKRLGVKKGDRVAALVTNSSEAVIAMLAVTSIGAIWSSCSPDFGFKGILERFEQIKPKILFAVNSYSYNGKTYDVSDTVNQIVRTIDEVEKCVVISDPDSINSLDIERSISWQNLIHNSADEITFEQLPFDHPLFIMYSSGTTGKPKCIVHGAGGTLLQHLKELVLHTDLSRDDVITYYTTCGWMMWNWLVSSLAIGATLFLYDGSPSYPNLETLFQAIDKEKVSIMGTSPKFLSVCQSSGLIPKEKFNLSSLKTILSTGAPLSNQNFEYVYHNIKEDIQLSSISGGTDIISCFMLGNPMLPVYKGELQCRGLGMKVESYNEKGQAVKNQTGELVCTAPFPSRPIYFWNDTDNEKYHAAYFDYFPGVWRHGDYININERGGIVVYGRSDATLNPGGIRIGTAEIYGPVEAMEEIDDSLVIGKKTNSDTEIILFVVLKENCNLTENLKNEIKNLLKKERSPRHVPSEIYEVDEIPRTLNGKKVELAVSKIIHGEEVTNSDALVNPLALENFKKFTAINSESLT